MGLDHPEVRRWDGWRWCLTLAMFALVYLAVLRARLQAQQGQAKPVTLAQAIFEVAQGAHQQLVDLRPARRRQ